MVPLSFERCMNGLTKPWIMLLMLVLIGLSYGFVDQPLAECLNGLQLNRRFPILSWFTKLGLVPIYLVLFFGLAMVFRYLRPNPLWQYRCWVLWVSVLVPAQLCLVLKMLLGRARPDLLFDQNLFGFYGFQTDAAYWSFPSGHTTTLTGLILAFWYLFPRYWRSLIALGISVVVTRVLLTQHYLSDVLATIYLTALEIKLMVVYFSNASWFKAKRLMLESQ